MEGCGYRDLHAYFEQLGVQVVGVSFDSPAALRQWSDRQGFPYELWSDTSKDLALYYGAIGSRAEATPRRVTRILNARGERILEYDGVRAATHPRQVLQDCNHLFGPLPAPPP